MRPQLAATAVESAEPFDSSISQGEDQLAHLDAQEGKSIEDLLADKVIREATPGEVQEDIYNVARAIYTDLFAGMTLSSVANSTENIDGFGIGHLLFNIEKKGMIIGGHSPLDVLDTLYKHASRAVNAPYISSRHKFIQGLKTLGFVDASLSDKEFKPAGTTPCLRDIGGLLQEATKVSIEDIASSSRSRNVVQARFQAIWILRVVCGHSLSMIGKHMGQRDHTTVLNSVNKMMTMISSDVAMRDKMEILCEKSDRVGVLKNRQIVLLPAIR